jgi:carbonic anhydrase/acetyltransferase-like protein (isoleucine patch superfamily)
MTVALLQSGRVVAPFGDSVLDMPAGTGTLRDHHAHVAAALGMPLTSFPSLADVETQGPTLLLPDDTFLTLRLARSFRDAMRGREEPGRVTLPKSRFVELYGQHQDLAFHDDGSASYDAWWFPRGVARGAAAALRDKATPVVVPFRERVLTFPVPTNIMGRPDMPHPLTTTVAFHIRHWVHVLWLGNLWPQIELVERITRSPVGSLLRAASSLRLGKEATFHALKRNFTYVGRDVSIHPTACVEYSVLGDGCRVGPFALVQGAVLGKGVHVEERANVMFSVLGDGDFVSKNSTVFACVGFPQADLCINGMQYCVAGRKSALTSLVRPMDMKYRDHVSVRMDGKTAVIKELMVGSCFGHHSFIGPEVLIAPGREIPNHTVIAPRPGAVMTRVDPRMDKGGTGCVVNGTLVPYPTE